MLVKLLIFIMPVILSGHAQTGKPELPAEFQKSVRKTFLANQLDTEACYSEVLKKEPKLEGKITMDFDIADNGKAVRCTVDATKTTINNEALGTCMCAKMSHWQFPASSKGQTVQIYYPFFFSAKKH